jgi:hypothetical protein
LASGVPVEAGAPSVPRHVEVEVNIAKEQNPRDGIATQLKRRRRSDESARMMDASGRAKHQAVAIRQLILEPDVVPTP